MKLSYYVEKVEKSEEFKNFKGKYPRAFLCAGFFVLDFEAGNNLEQIDYFLPAKNKIANFMIQESIIIKIEDCLSDKKSEKLEKDSNLSLEEIQEIAKQEVDKQGLIDLKKIIAVIIKSEGKIIWSLNCIASGLNMLNIRIDDKTKKILKSEKVNLMSAIRKI